MDATDQLQVLTVGLEDGVIRFINPLLKAAVVTQIKSDEVEKMVESPPTITPNLIICGIQIQGLSPYEIAQFLRSQYQDILIFFASMERSQFEKAILLKNGYNDTFILAIDQSALKQSIMDVLSKFGKSKSYRSVKLMDIQPESVLDFDVSIFLPANKKHILFSPAGEPIGAERAKRLEKHQIKSVYIEQDKLKAFYQYSANRLKEINSSATMSETERKEKMQQMIRGMLSDVLGDGSKEGTFDQGKAIISDCQKIVSTYVMNTTRNDWLKQVLSTLDGETDSYSHTANVASFAAMFSLATGLGKPEDLALAGLMHDIGLGRVPFEIQDKAEELRTKDEQEQYQKHVEHSLELIKQQKVILPEIVTKMISQHHERFSGGGYPKGLIGDRICVEAQILAIADQFDYLTCTLPGRPRLGPLEAIQKMRDEDAKDPGRMRFKPDLLNKLVGLFQKQ